jgi:hypothetical protein
MVATTGAVRKKWHTLDLARYRPTLLIDQQIDVFMRNVLTKNNNFDIRILINPQNSTKFDKKE